MEFCDAANLAIWISRISFDDHLSYFGVWAAIDDEAQLYALMRRIKGRIHPDSRREVPILSEDALHALDARCYKILVKFLPDLQLAAIHQLVRSWGPRGSVHDQAADIQLLLHHEIHIEEAVGRGCNLGGDGSKPPCGKQLLQARAHGCPVQDLSRLQRN